MTQPGTYTGADGREYRVEHQTEAIIVQTDPYPMNAFVGITGRSTLFPKHPDFPAAKAALDALVEQEREEWVEFSDDSTGETIECRIRKDGSDPQVMGARGTWVYVDVHWMFVEAYRTGRSVALSENEAVRDAARELVDLTLGILSILGIQPASHFYQLPFDDCSRLLIFARKLSGLLEGR